MRSVKEMTVSEVLTIYLSRNNFLLSLALTSTLIQGNSEAVKEMIFFFLDELRNVSALRRLILILNGSSIKKEFQRS